jgi:hypothetical protein
MIERIPSQRPAELRCVAVDPGGDWYTAWTDGRPIGRLRALAVEGWLRVTVDDDGMATEPAERRALLEAVSTLAASEYRYGVVLAAGGDLLLRHAARAAGFVGPLRGDLARGGGHPAMAAHDGGIDQFLSDLTDLLPGMSVTAADHHASRLRSFMRGASSGISGVVHLSAGRSGDSELLSVSVPVADDVMAEGVALAIDTALDVRRRFHPRVDRVRLFFDQRIAGLRSGSVAGLAEPSSRDVHLNPAYALASQMEEMNRNLRERRALASPGQPEPRISYARQPPFTRIDAVVAHEYWHQLEFDLEGSRYRESAEFRQAVGNYFGVETLEHVIKGASASSPPVWQAARVRLAQEVSLYATTAPKEATAELFSQWWCTPSAPPPSARFFGDVLRHFFPDADLAR